MKNLSISVILGVDVSIRLPKTLAHIIIFGVASGAAEDRQYPETAWTIKASSIKDAQVLRRNPNHHINDWIRKPRDTVPARPVRSAPVSRLTTLTLA